MRRLSVVNFIALPDIDRFLQLGAIGRFDLAPAVIRERRMIARREVENIIAILAAEPMGVQIAVVDEVLPSITFQIFRSGTRTALGLSPFRLGGDLPNLESGVGMLTAAEEPVRLYEEMCNSLWQRAEGIPGY